MAKDAPTLEHPTTKRIGSPHGRPFRNNTCLPFLSTAMAPAGESSTASPSRKHGHHRGRHQRHPRHADSRRCWTTGILNRPMIACLQGYHAKTRTQRCAARARRFIKNAAHFSKPAAQ